MSFQSALSFAFSIYGLLTLLAALLIFGILWSDQLKKKWYDRIELKKWRQHNPQRPAGTATPPPENRDPNP